MQKNNSLKTSVYNWSENTDSNRFKNDENLRIFYVNASADEIILIFQLSWFLLNGTSVRTIKWTFFSQFNTSLIGEVTMFIIILHEYVIVHNNFVHVTVSQFVYIVRSANFYELKHIFPWNRPAFTPIKNSSQFHLQFHSEFHLFIWDIIFPMR